MDQTTELLNSLTEDEIAKYATNSSSEEHIVIGADRKITVPSSLKRLAVQFDHNVETVTFDAPRYWDGIDMATSEFVTYINYILPDHTPGAYVAKNVRIDEADDSVMHFDWTIEGNITQTQGNIAFLVCHKKLGQVEVTYEQTVYDEDGNPVLDENDVEQTETVTEMRDTLVNHWNSEPCKDCYISEGMECDEAVLEMYPDVLTQVLLAINRFEGMEVTQFVQKLEGIENDISENDSAIQVLEEKVAELEGDAASKAEMDALKTRMETAEQDILTLKDEDEHILEHAAELQAQINAVEDQLNNLEIAGVADTLTDDAWKLEICKEDEVTDTGWTKIVRAATLVQNNGTFKMTGVLKAESVAGASGTNILTQADIATLTNGLITKVTAAYGTWHGEAANETSDSAVENGPCIWFENDNIRFGHLDANLEKTALALSRFSASTFVNGLIHFEIFGRYEVVNPRIWMDSRAMLAVRIDGNVSGYRGYITSQTGDLVAEYDTLSNEMSINMYSLGLTGPGAYEIQFYIDNDIDYAGSNKILYVVRKLGTPTLSYNGNTKILTITGDPNTVQYRLYGMPDEDMIVLAASNGVATYNCYKDTEYSASVYAVALADGYATSESSEPITVDYYNY